MTEVTLIRHGQANTGAKDEESYDRLSDLGHRQAGWLGDYFRTTDEFDRVVSGTLRRQRQTAAGLALDHLPHETDPRLNEIDYFGLAQSVHDSHGIAFPNNQEEFAAHIPQVLELWKNNLTDPKLESYQSFHDRILAALHDAGASGQRTLLVSSTGVISTLTAIALGLDMVRKSKMFLKVSHTSIHRFELAPDDLYLTQFCATPHLDAADRRHAITMV